MKKLCKRCNTLKSESDFGKNKNEKSGLSFYCKKCNIACNKESKAKSGWQPKDNGRPKSNIPFPERRSLYKRTANLKRFGLTEDSYKLILDNQNNSCAICNKQFIPTSKAYVDHCHSKGHVRGILCLNCNVTLGHVNDDVNILKNMVKYLGV